MISGRSPGGKPRTAITSRPDPRARAWVCSAGFAAATSIGAESVSAPAANTTATARFDVPLAMGDSSQRLDAPSTGLYRCELTAPRDRRSRRLPGGANAPPDPSRPLVRRRAPVLGLLLPGRPGWLCSTLDGAWRYRLASGAYALAHSFQVLAGFARLEDGRAYKVRASGDCDVPGPPRLPGHPHRPTGFRARPPPGDRARAVRPTPERLVPSYVAAAQTLIGHHGRTAVR